MKVSTFQLFRTDLWKDQRYLEVRDVSGRECLVKSFTSTSEAEQEAVLLRYLKDKLGIAQVPDVVELHGNCLIVPYIRGIRVFNLLVELDRLEHPLHSLGSTIKKLIIAQCQDRQKEIQHALTAYQWENPRAKYPASEKLRSVILVLSDAAGITVNWSKIDQELARVDELWLCEATIPFRDATTKNMVLAEPRLWLGGFESEEARRAYLVSTLRELQPEKFPDWLPAPICDFDFSSCNEDSTPEDDPISLLYHERTWLGPPSGAESVIWHGSADGRRAALTFLVRYYRFGGRKAAYRLIHPSGHRIRFRHDNDLFYFERLSNIVTVLWPEGKDEIPGLLEFTRALTRAIPGGRPELDGFLAAGFGEKRRYYVDMYPE